METSKKKFYLTLFGLLAGALALSTASAVYLQKKRLEGELHLRALALARTFQHIASENLERRQTASVQIFLDSLMADPDLEEAHLLDLRGAPVVSKLRHSTSGAFRLNSDLFSQSLKAWTPQFADVKEGDGRYQIVYQRAWSEELSGISTLGMCYLKFNYYRLDREVWRAIALELFMTGLFVILVLTAACLFSSHIAGAVRRAFSPPELYVRASKECLGAE